MKIIKNISLVIYLFAISYAVVNSSDNFNTLVFETNDNKTIRIKNHPLISNVTPTSLQASGLEYIIDNDNIPHVSIFSPSSFVYQIFSIPHGMELVKTFINQAATTNTNTFYSTPIQLNYLFKILNNPEPITIIPDMPQLDNNIALQYIAKVLTEKLPNRPSLIGPYLANIKKQFSNDNNAYQAAMQPIKNALYHTLRYLSDFDTQTIQSLELAKKIVDNVDLNKYFSLSNSKKFLLAMESNLKDKEPIIEIQLKFEKFLHDLLELPAK